MGEREKTPHFPNRIDTKKKQQQLSNLEKKTRTVRYFAILEIKRTARQTPTIFVDMGVILPNIDQNGRKRYKRMKSRI